MSESTTKRNPMTARVLAVLIIAGVFAVLNVCGILNWVLAGSKFESDTLLNAVNVLVLVTPIAYLGFILLTLAGRPKTGASLLLVQIVSYALSYTWFFSTGSPAASFLPLASLMSLTADYWAGGLLLAFEPLAIIAIALLLLLPTKRAITTN